jgi:hypothetical protein
VTSEVQLFVLGVGETGDREAFHERLTVRLLRVTGESLVRGKPSPLG